MNRTLFNHAKRLNVILVALVVSLLAAACSSNTQQNTQSLSKTMVEYVGGNWITFTSPEPLNPSDWEVVNAYANFSSAVLSVFKLRSVAPLATVVSTQSKVTSMFTRDLASGQNPEALYNKVVVESVHIHGCRATMVLKLYYPNGKQLTYVSSWVKPFDKSLLAHDSKGNVWYLKSNYSQHAPWLFVGDNRVGGLDNPCGI